MVRVLARGLSSQVTVDSVMSADPVTVNTDTTAADALRTMRTRDVRHLPVVRESRLMGMVSLADLLWHLTVQGADVHCERHDRKAAWTSDPANDAVVDLALTPAS